ncbi:hypothetical protein [Burkholderia thailandensis]|uniref:hypothetical protein n=1 Tax=Burkholderia thailandensis TaxID=57975 RepID=UPI0022ABF0BD|nr:hypothetical protein [Burkholderia thailandensis]
MPRKLVLGLRIALPQRFRMQANLALRTLHRIGETALVLDARRLPFALSPRMLACLRSECSVGLRGRFEQLPPRILLAQHRTLERILQFCPE